MAESAGQDGVYDGEVDTLHTRSSGVTDILITGEVCRSRSSSDVKTD